MDINNEINTGENRLTQENIEELRRLIKEHINNGLYKKDLETWKMENQTSKMKTARTRRTTTLRMQKFGH